MSTYTLLLGIVICFKTHTLNENVFCFFSITLAPCQGEFDITIIDRICTLLNPQPICVSSPATGAARENIVSCIKLNTKYSQIHNLFLKTLPKLLSLHSESASVILPSRRKPITARLPRGHKNLSLQMRHKPQVTYHTSRTSKLLPLLLSAQFSPNI